MVRTTFRVVWEIDVEADSPTEAAIKAQEYQRDYDAVVGYFETVGPDGLRIGVDLDERPIQERPVTQ